MSNNKINELFLLTQKAKKYETHNEAKALELYLEIYHDYNSKISSTYESTIRLLEKNKRYKEAQEVCIDAIKKIDNKEISGYRKTFVQKLNRIDKKIKLEDEEKKENEENDLENRTVGKKKFTFKKVYTKKKSPSDDINEDNKESDVSGDSEVNKPRTYDIENYADAVLREAEAIKINRSKYKNETADIDSESLNSDALSTNTYSDTKGLNESDYSIETDNEKNVHSETQNDNHDRNSNNIDDTSLEKKDVPLSEEEELDRLKDEVEQALLNFSKKNSSTHTTSSTTHNKHTNYSKKSHPSTVDKENTSSGEDKSNRLADSNTHPNTPKSTEGHLINEASETNYYKESNDDSDSSFFWKRKYTIRLFVVCILITFFVVSLGEKSYNNLFVNLEGKEALEGADEIFDKDKSLDENNEEVIEYIITDEMMALTKSALEKYYDVDAVTFTLQGNELGMGVKMIPSSSEEKSKEIIVEGLTILSGLAAAEYKDLQGPDGESLGGIYDYYGLTLASVVNENEEDYLAKGTKSKGVQNIHWLPVNSADSTSTEN